MIYHPRTPQEAVNLRKEHADTAVYLARGTHDLRPPRVAARTASPQKLFKAHLYLE